LLADVAVAAAAEVADVATALAGARPLADIEWSLCFLTPAALN
jgi:hypothetical protein